METAEVKKALKLLKESRNPEDRTVGTKLLVEALSSYAMNSKAVKGK